MHAVVAFPLAVGCCFARPGTADAPDPRQILIRSLQPSVRSYEGDQVTVNTPPGGQPRTSYEHVYRDDGRIRIEFRNGRWLLDDGESAYLYFPGLRLVEKSPSTNSPAALRRQLRFLRSGRGDVKLLGEGEMLGRPVYTVQVVQPNGMERVIWVDRARLVQLRQDVTFRRGRKTSTYFTRITFDAAIPSEKFRFTLPAGARLVQAEPGLRQPIPERQAYRRATAWGGLLVPGYVPAGYQLRAFYAHQYRGQPGVVAVYDGPRPGSALSVFQGPPSGMGPLEAHPRGARDLQVLTRPFGAAEATLVGPLEPGELQKIMESLRPAPPPRSGAAARRRRLRGRQLRP